jgi:dTMP kinase
MSHNGARGIFITLEGGEGVGKSTQLKRLAARLRTMGRDVIETREPGGSPGAEAIRELLLHAPADAWNAATEALLFAAARSDHVARVIEPALARGAWVICDRYVDSTRAYQGAAGGVTDADIMALHAVGSGGLMPDRTLLLRVSEAESDARRTARQLDRPDRFEGKSAAYHRAVVAAFDRLAAAEPVRFRVIDANGSADDVEAAILSTIEDLL